MSCKHKNEAWKLYKLTLPIFEYYFAVLSLALGRLKMKEQQRLRSNGIENSKAFLFKLYRLEYDTNMDENTKITLCYHWMKLLPPRNAIIHVLKQLGQRRNYGKCDIALFIIAGLQSFNFLQLPGACIIHESITLELF